LKVLSTLFAVWMGISVLIHLGLWGLLPMLHIRRLRRAIFNFCGFKEEDASTTNEEDAPATNGEKVPAVVHKGQRMKTTLNEMSFGSEVALFILSTELVITWNHISGVGSLGSTAQLLPLIIGGIGLLRVLYKFITKCSRGHYSESTAVLLRDEI